MSPKRRLIKGDYSHAPDHDGDLDDDDERYRFVACDLLDWMETRAKLGPLAEQVTHVFWVTWASQFPLDTQECCDQNRVMLSNALDALLPPVPRPALVHLALQTGTKHYVSLKQGGADGCHVYYYEEESPRADEGVHNFYYALEDLVKDRLGGGSGGRRIASWSVHPPLFVAPFLRQHCKLSGSETKPIDLNLMPSLSSLSNPVDDQNPIFPSQFSKFSGGWVIHCKP